MGEGFKYTTLAERLLGGSEPDVLDVCKDYFGQYEGEGSGGASITLVKTAGMDNLAEVCKPVFETYRKAIEDVNTYKVQRLFRNHPWFFDMMHLLEVSGVDEESLAKVQKALDDCIMYKDHTDEFLGYPLTHYCGLAMFAPSSDTDLLDYYHTLSWNQATGLVK